jgi:type IV secretion system protein VirB10
MTDKTIDPNSSPQVHDRRTTPPGILPKNAQAWVLTGVAVAMIAVIALSGKNPTPRASPPPSSAVVDPNAARIQEYQKRIEEQTRKLQIEQAELERSQEALGSKRPGSRPAETNARAFQERRWARVSTDRAIESSMARESPQTDQDKREYQSLFASNVALSYRKLAMPVPDPGAPPSPETLTRMLSLYSALAALQQTGLQTAPPKAGQPQSASSAPSPEADRGGERRANPEGSSDRDRSGTDGKSYHLFEGTILETVLTNRLDGSFSGPVNCMMTTNVFSSDGQHLLIPQGSRLLGEVHKVDSFGQERLAVFFHRLIMLDGYSVSLDQFHALNQIGETGLRDQVNHHYLQVFGISLAIGAIAGLGQVNTGTVLDRSGLDAYEQGVAGSLSQSSLRILDRYLNVLPTFTIREGHRVKVYLSQDLLLPAYDRHPVPSNS